MNKLVICTLLVVPACKSVPRASVAAEIEAVCGAQAAAWNDGDIERFMKAGYWHSPDLVFFSGGNDTRGFDPVLAGFVKRYGSGDAEMGKLAFTRMEAIALSNEAGIVRGRWDLDFERKADVGGLFTLIFRKLEDGWRIVHDHTSVDAPAPN